MVMETTLKSEEAQVVVGYLGVGTTGIPFEELVPRNSGGKADLDNNKIFSSLRLSIFYLVELRVELSHCYSRM